MSYDVAPRCPYCDREGDNSNHTSNTSGMWTLAGCDIRSFHGKPVAEIIPALNAAILELSQHPEKYRSMEGPPQCGSVESTVRFLKEIRAAMEDARPHDVVEVCA